MRTSIKARHWNWAQKQMKDTNLWSSSQGISLHKNKSRFSLTVDIHIWGRAVLKISRITDKLWVLFSAMYCFEPFCVYWNRILVICCKTLKIAIIIIIIIISSRIISFILPCVVNWIYWHRYIFVQSKKPSSLRVQNNYTYLWLADEMKKYQYRTKSTLHFHL